MKLAALEELRQQNPIVFNISNFVTVQDVANGINALGASPIMSEEITEAEEMVQMASAVVLNLGAFTERQVAQIQRVGELANKYHKPLVIDPVAVGAVQYRKQVATKLLADFQVDIIRGNAGEIAALADVDWQAKGIDAGEGNQDLVAVAKACATKQHAIVILSGPTDIITDGTQVCKVFNGTPLFQLHVGSVDMLSSVVGVFAGVLPDYFEAAQTACATFASAGERVAATLPAEQPGTFAAKLFDELHLMTLSDLTETAKFEVQTND